MRAGSPRAATLILAGTILAAAASLSYVRSGTSAGWGRMGIWDILAGPADQGPVDFSVLTRRTTPNDCLIAPAGLTPAARPDALAPRWSVSPDVLRARLLRVIGDTPDVTQVAEAGGSHGDRFVARTRIMRFPDTIDVLVLPDGEGATVALYSRSLVGRSDLGVNRKRLDGWLADPALLADRR